MLKDLLSPYSWNVIAKQSYVRYYRNRSSDSMRHKLIDFWKDVETGKKILISRIHTSHPQIRVKPACEMYTTKKPQNNWTKKVVRHYKKLPRLATDCFWRVEDPARQSHTWSELVLMILLTQSGILKNSVQVTQHTWSMLKIGGAKVQNSLWKITRARTQWMVLYIIMSEKHCFMLF